MENKTLCKECRGKCCKSMGCHFSPDDFNDLSYEGLKKVIEKGFISIDWWEGSPFDDSDDSGRALFLRMRNKKSRVIDPSWMGECILLTKEGCPLAYENRPKGGRLLIPDKKGCRAEYTKNDAARDWFKYNDTLLKILIEIEEKEWNMF